MIYRLYNINCYYKALHIVIYLPGVAKIIDRVRKTLGRQGKGGERHEVYPRQFRTKCRCLRAMPYK